MAQLVYKRALETGRAIGRPFRSQSQDKATTLNAAASGRIPGRIAAASDVANNNSDARGACATISIYTTKINPKAG
jgi:hypothetical protein